MESLHELAMAEAADAHAQELDRIRMRKESDVLEAQRAAVAEAEARGKAEQELDNFRAEVQLTKLDEWWVSSASLIVYSKRSR